MANRRMFSMKIVDTDAFLDMPQTTQLLYFHLAMRADDDGFVANPKKIIRMIGSQGDDFKVLSAKKFIIPFDSGICVIKHWKIHNYIQSDRYTPTQWINEKKQLITDPINKKYSLDKQKKPDCIQSVSISDTQVRLGKVRLGKNNRQPAVADNGIQQIFDIFYESINPTINFGNKTQREAAKWLIHKFGLEKTIKFTKYSCSIQGKKYAPIITTPYQLKEKIANLKIYYEQNNAKKVTKLD